MRLRLAGGILSVALVAAGCGQEGAVPPGGGGELVAQVASYDLAVGTEPRLLIGLGTGANLFVTGGTVGVRLFFLGEEEASGEPELVEELTASFLPLPGTPAGPDTRHPVTTPGSEARGVYAARDVTFDRAGFWEAEVIADFGGGDIRRGTAAFQVLPEHRYPAAGDEAIPTENLTVDSKGAPPEAVDSRAASEGRIPDPQLHRTTIADAIRAGRPALVVFATPVYCISKFCGPVTDMVADLEKDYGDRADFIHVEIWRDFQGGVINKAAADWLLREGDLLEPWVYLIGADGRIAARWDNVATRQEIEPLLAELPEGG